MSSRRIATVLRTPERCFSALPKFPYTPKYCRVQNDPEIRVAYLDEGPADAQETVLLMHGEPSWSYLYRSFVEPLRKAGFRVVAPDLVGFGRSDKPAEQSDYTYQRHVDWMTSFLVHADLRGVTLFCQDWGGLIGLRLVAAHEERFRRVVASNTFLPTGDQKVPAAFKKWQDFVAKTPGLKVGRIIQGGTLTELPDEVVAAYDAPYPDDSYKAGAQSFPMLVPTTPDNPASAANRAAWQRLMKWEKPFLTAFGDSDPITAGADKAFHKLVPGTRGQAHTTVSGSHFVQEDAGEELAGIIERFIRATPDPSGVKSKI